MRNLKKVLSLTLALVMLLGMMVVGAGAAEYKDASDIDYKEAADVLTAIGVMQGTDGNFNPKVELNRAEGAAIVYRLLTGGMEKNPSGGVTGFVDVDGNADFAWATGIIADLAQKGIISGEDATHFNPSGKLSGYAFGKMLLVALGYNATSQGYTGGGWEGNVLRDARTHDILVGGVIMSKDLSREEAAQMALQTLQSPMVYQKGGIQIGEVVIPGDKAERVPGAGDGKGSKDFRKGSTDDDYIELCEAYFPTLKLDATTGDAFKRTANIWTYEKKAVGTYPAASSVSYNAGVSTSKVEDDLDGITIDESFDLYENGKKTTKDSGMTAAEIKDLTGNGVVVEISISDGKVTKIVVVKSVLAKVTKVDEKKETNTYKTVATGDAYATGSVSFTSDVGYGAYEKDDMVMIAVADTVNATLNAAGKVQTVDPAGVVKGMGTGKSTKDDTITVDGTAYEMAEIVETGKGIGDFGVSSKYEATLYLDTFGYVVSAVPGEADTKDHAIAALRFYQTMEDGEIVHMVKGVLSDGTTVDQKIKNTNLTTADDANKVYTYDDEWQLTAVNPTTDLSKTTAPAFGDVFSVLGTGYDRNSIDAKALSAQARYKTSTDGDTTATYYFAKDVKFIYVKDGSATVLEGVKAVSTKAMTFVLGAKSGSTPLISTVYVADEAPGGTTTTDDLIFVKGGSTGDVSFVVDGQTKSFKTYDAWSNGEKIENFYSATNVSTSAFYKTSIKESTGEYVLTSAYNVSTGKAAVTAEATVTATVGGDVLTTDANTSTDYKASDAKVIAVASGAPTSVSGLISDTKTAKVMIIYNEETMTAEYIFVTSWANTPVGVQDSDIVVPAAQTAKVSYSISGDTENAGVTLNAAATAKSGITFTYKWAGDADFSSNATKTLAAGADPLNAEGDGKTVTCQIKATGNGTDYTGTATKTVTFTIDVAS